MKERIIAVLAAGSMLLCSSAVSAFAEEISPVQRADNYMMEPLPPEEEQFRANGLIFIIYTPNQYTEIVKDKYAYVSGVEEGVTSVTIPAEADGVPVKGILDAAMRSKDLKEILVGEGQEHFSSVDGVLFNRSGDTLEAYPLGKTGTYAVPNGTKYINSYALSAMADYNGLTEITFPESLVEIKSHALENQCGMTEIVLPDSCQTVREQAFANCKNATRLHVGKNLRTFLQPCDGCTSLCEITSNAYYYPAKDNILYGSTDSSFLTLYPAGLTAERFDLPSSVTGLAPGSFADNPYLKEVVINSTIDYFRDTFLNMGALESLTFPEGLTTIEGQVVYNCPSLKTVRLPKTLTYITYNYANALVSFLGKTPALTDVYYNGLEPEFEKIQNVMGNKNIYRKGVTIHYADEDTYESFFDGDELTGGFTYKLFEDHAEVAGYTLGTKRPHDLDAVIEVPSEVKGLPVTTVGRKAFTNLANVAELVLPDSILVIKERAFQGTLTLVNVPKRVEYIGDSAFFGARLQTVTLPGTLKTMGKYVFRKSNVQELIVEEGVTELGECAFGECSRLTSVTLPSTLQEIPSYAFNYTKSLESVKLPYGLERIGDFAFNGSGIRKINLPETLKDVNRYAFADCKNLTAVNMPPKITCISESMFNGSGLEDVTIPATVEKIESKAFCDCRKLKRITILNPDCKIYRSADTICSTYEVYDQTAPEYGYEMPEPTPVVAYDLTICGYADSTAQSYADTHVIPFEVYDPDAYDVTDVVSMQRFLLGQGASVNHRNYDLNGDEIIDIYDLALLKWKLTAK